MSIIKIIIIIALSIYLKSLLKNNIEKFISLLYDNLNDKIPFYYVIHNFLNQHKNISDGYILLFIMVFILFLII